MNALRVMSSLISRARLGGMAGQTFGGNRDLYTQLGYKRALDYNDFWERYKRQGIARRVVTTPATATWRNFPIISEADLDDETSFLTEWFKLSERLRFYHYAERADKIAGIGRYAVLLIGAKDGRPLNLPLEKVKGPEDILYLAPYSEGNAEIKELESDKNSSRFGLPKFYNIKFSRESSRGIATQTLVPNSIVHYSRVIHISDGLLEDDIFGDPRMECVWNYLDDLDKISGGSAEAFWRIVDRGMAFVIDKDAEISEEEEAAFSDEIEDYVNKLKRYMRLKGMDVKVLGSETPDPRGAFAVTASLIAGTVGIPMRVLFGSERGELASSQDEKNFNARIKERQQSFAGPMIVHPFIDKMIEIGALPTPPNGYSVTWPDLSTLSKQEEADVAARFAQATRNLALTIKENPEFISAGEARTRWLGLGPDIQR